MSSSEGWMVRRVSWGKAVREGVDLRWCRRGAWMARPKMVASRTPGNWRSWGRSVETMGDAREVDSSSRREVLGWIGVGELLEVGYGAEGDESRHVDVADAPAALGFVHVVGGD